MIKRCKVVLSNPATIVIDYDGKLIQFPFQSGVIDWAYVKYDEGIYSITSESQWLSETVYIDNIPLSSDNRQKLLEENNESSHKNSVKKRKK